MVFNVMLQFPKVNAKEEVVIAFIEVDNSEAVYLRVAWVLLDHLCDYIEPALVYMSVLDGYL